MFKNTNVNGPFSKLGRPLLCGWVGGWWTVIKMGVQFPWILNMLKVMLLSYELYIKSLTTTFLWVRKFEMKLE